MRHEPVFPAAGEPGAVSLRSDGFRWPPAGRSFDDPDECTIRVDCVRNPDRAESGLIEGAVERALLGIPMRVKVSCSRSQEPH
jgi:hypothetical protein